eukprot:TRINITY_DN42856_c0_g1_i1.p1 TRINITY_DN42856_c0_g1~~TRINITY_DN42856_c0_g1_i1.p1  ORF type:complete len:523 (+),score=93.44 TRINITY_DN42856_c0_g1_i1:118-1686(+)
MFLPPLVESEQGHGASMGQSKHFSTSSSMAAAQSAHQTSAFRQNSALRTAAFMRRIQAEHSLAVSLSPNTAALQILRPETSASLEQMQPYTGDFSERPSKVCRSQLLSAQPMRSTQPACSNSWIVDPVRSTLPECSSASSPRQRRHSVGASRRLSKQRPDQDACGGRPETVIPREPQSARSNRNMAARRSSMISQSQGESSKRQIWRQGRKFSVNRSPPLQALQAIPKQENSCSKSAYPKQDLSGSSQGGEALHSELRDSSSACLQSRMTGSQAQKMGNNGRSGGIVGAAFELGGEAVEEQSAENLLLGDSEQGKPEESFWKKCNRLAKRYGVDLNDVRHSLREFDEADVDKSGRLSFDEFQSIIRKQCDLLPDEAIPPHLARSTWASVDADGDGSVDADEYIKWIKSHQWAEELMVPNREEREMRQFCRDNGYALPDVEDVKAAFDKADEDGSGALDEKEFRQTLCSLQNVEESDIAVCRFRQLWREVDANQDGSICFPEFCTWWMRQGLNPKDLNRPVRL